MATEGTAPQAQETLGDAISKAALRKISKKTTGQFVAELREQGISSLEDLANAVISTAKAGAGRTVAFDAEDFPICYKFTTMRPRFDKNTLDEIVNQIDQKLLR